MDRATAQQMLREVMDKLHDIQRILLYLELKTKKDSKHWYAHDV